MATRKPPRLTLGLLLVLIHQAGLLVAPVAGARWSQAEGRHLFEGAVACTSPDLPNPCFNADGSAFICCGPESCPSSPGSEPRCAGSAGNSQGSPTTCDSNSPLPNQCFDSNGQTFVCCAGQCGGNAPGSPTCASANNNANPPPVGNTAQPPPSNTAQNEDQCTPGSSLPNQCFNADGSAFTCCPAECGNPPKAVPYCSGSALGNLPDRHLYPLPATLGTVPGIEDPVDDASVPQSISPIPPSTEPVLYGAANLPPLTNFNAFPAGQSFPVMSEAEALQQNLARFYNPSQGGRKRSLLQADSVANVRVTFVVIINNAGQGDVSDALLLEVVNRINVFWQDMPFRFRPHLALRVRSEANYNLVQPQADRDFCAFKSAWRRGTAEDLFLYIVGDLSLANGGRLNGISMFPSELAQSGVGCDGVIVRQGRIPGYSAEISNGDTFAHEIGHWMELYHTFEPLGRRTGCEGGDEVADTPPQLNETVSRFDASQNFLGVSQPGFAVCRRAIFRCPGAVDAEPYWNLMSYGACREWFTPGQAERALGAWKRWRKGQGAVTPPPPGPLPDVSGNTLISSSSFPVGTTGAATVTVEILGNSAVGLQNKPPADVAFVLDVSGSLDDSAFQQEKNFTVAAITDLRDGGLFFNGGTVSIIQFSDTLDVILERATDSAGALNGAQTMTRKSAGLTATGDALQKARDILDQGTGQTQIIVLITDGINNTGVDPAPVAASAKDAGITIIGIGVGSQLDRTRIVPWTGQKGSSDNYYFAVSDFFALASQLGAVISKAFPQAQNVTVRGTVDAKFPPISDRVAVTGTITAPTDRSFEWRVETVPAGSKLQMRFSIQVPCTALPAGQYSVFSSLTWEDSRNQNVLFPPLDVTCT